MRLVVSFDPGTDPQIKGRVHTWLNGMVAHMEARWLPFGVRVQLLDDNTPRDPYQGQGAMIDGALHVYDNGTWVVPIQAPRRGDAVEAFIKRARDQYINDGSDDTGMPWITLDNLLDDYRLHADTGTTLTADAPD